MRARTSGKRAQARAILSVLALLYPAVNSAQDIDFQHRIDAAAEALILLDVKASDCLSALDGEADARLACDDFMTAIDGELIAGYLGNCRELKGWRDDYVTRSVASNGSVENADNEEMLRRLVAIEYYCGSDTVSSRTEFVAVAFDRLRVSRAAQSNAGDATSISRQLSERRFDALQQSERRRLHDAVQDQQTRSLQQSERQFNDLENELLRQQIQNANRSPD